MLLGDRDEKLMQVYRWRQNLWDLDMHDNHPEYFDCLLLHQCTWLE